MAQVAASSLTGATLPAIGSRHRLQVNPEAIRLFARTVA